MLRYLDTCLPDYFHGFSGHVYAIPLCKGMTYREVFNELKKAIESEEIYGFEGNYSAIENECDGMRFAAKERGFLDSVFNEYLSDDENAETCFAYFGVKID